MGLVMAKNTFKTLDLAALDKVLGGSDTKKDIIDGAGNTGRRDNGPAIEPRRKDQWN
jgi:hypothetical protein